MKRMFAFLSVLVALASLGSGAAVAQGHKADMVMQHSVMPSSEVGTYQGLVAAGTVDSGDGGGDGVSGAAVAQGHEADIVIQHSVMPSSEVGTYQGPVAAGTLFRWREVGGDPCNPRAGCTLQYALERSGWPLEVQQEFRRIVRVQAGREVVITRGWQGWMTWGSQTAKFHPKTLADFSQNEPALEWIYGFQGTEYVLIRVHRCRNWGGNTRRPTPPQPTQPATPLVSCP